jgi:hypothetical protein
MQRTTTLLQKITDLVNKEAQASAIDVDLALDYTRVLYADLLEWRSRVTFNNSLSGTAAPPPQSVPEPPVQKVEIQEPVIEILTIPTEREAELETATVTATDTAAAVDPELVSNNEPADIRKWIGINDKYQFISELFGNDKEAYESVLDLVNNADGYDSAVDALDDTHTLRNWNDEEITVQSFYSVLNQFFSER